MGGAHLQPLLQVAGLPTTQVARPAAHLRHPPTRTNPEIVSEALGHQDIHITLDRGSHALPTLQRRL